MARSDVDGYANLYLSFAVCYESLLEGLGRDRSHVEEALIRECRPLPEISEELVEQSQDLPEAAAILDDFRKAFPLDGSNIKVRYVDPHGEIMRCLDSTVVYPSLRHAQIDNFEDIVLTLKMAALLDAYMNRRVPEMVKAAQPTWKDRLPRIEDIPPETVQAGGAVLNLALELFSEVWQTRANRQARVSNISHAIKAAEAGR